MQTEELGATRITSLQNDYLRAIAAGHDTSRALMQRFGTGQSAVYRIIYCLRGAGLLQHTTHPPSHQYTLTMPYHDMKYTTSTPRQTITTAELENVARLRKDGWTGCELITAHQKDYPGRSEGSIKSLVMKARRQGLCR